jgi:hypothetical protein
MVSAIGALLGRKQLGRFGQALPDDIDQTIEIHVLFGRHRHHVEKSMLGGQFRRERQQLVLGIDQVDLVDDCDRFAARLADTSQHGFVLLVEAQRFDHEDDEIRVGERGGGGAIHRPIEGALLAQVQSGRIDEGELNAGAIQHTQHPMARGLRPRGDDGEFLADQRVQQRRLADVGPSDQSRETRTKFYCVRH